MEINVLIDKGFEQYIDESWLRSIAEKVIVNQDTGRRVELGLVITGQEKIQQLNLSYLGQDKPTDVLAFSVVEEVGGNSSPFVMPPDGVLHLGEVIISYQQAVIQAEEHRHSIKREVAILIIHGILHLLGYEHDKPELESIMSSREREILNTIENDSL